LVKANAGNENLPAQAIEPIWKQIQSLIGQQLSHLQQDDNISILKGRPSCDVKEMSKFLS
jgi:hypothetical protein